MKENTVPNPWILLLVLKRYDGTIVSIADAASLKIRPHQDLVPKKQLFFACIYRFFSLYLI